MADTIARILQQLLQHLLGTCGQDGEVVVGLSLLMFEDLQLQEELLLMETSARGLYRKFFIPLVRMDILMVLQHFNLQNNKLYQTQQN